ncbi:unnamed protein product [Spirodela intermedia]|uniref:Cationic amino acid transporter C-terminal domain-containing protein n=1 Tax=Spirodela intermedia TaxID=51605 RepID=A0A7I8IU24_SPIIN|nr:unnamed protein product [Spirodela intermedia]CAA6660638.1 unnamed protein product [Spirodela intermedia]
MENGGGGASSSSSFSGLRAYGRALAQTPARLRRRAWSVSTAYEEMSQVRARSGGHAEDSPVVGLRGPGHRGMVGAGVFVTTGRAARLCAGPAVVLSYATAGLSAWWAFNRRRRRGYGCFLIRFCSCSIDAGEFAAFLTGANLVMDYVFSNAAVARSFTAYLGTAIGVATTERWRITVTGLPEGFNQIDFLAVGVILVISLCICYRFLPAEICACFFHLHPSPSSPFLLHVGAYTLPLGRRRPLNRTWLVSSTKESSALNMALTAVHLLFILFIIVMGFWRGDVRNFTHPADPASHAGGFLPFGATGVFDGAAMVYLSYIGYDAVSTMAEEAEEPTRDIPAGVSGSVALVTVIYCLMAASMSMLVPYDAVSSPPSSPEGPAVGQRRRRSHLLFPLLPLPQIDVESPFSSAFEGSSGGWRWVSNVIGAGASLGILTSLLVSMLSQARYLCVIGRSGVVPAWLARVNPVTSTPVNASASLGIATFPLRHDLSLSLSLTGFTGVATGAIALITDLNVLLNLVTIGTLFVFYMVANAVVYRRYVVLLLCGFAVGAGVALQAFRFFVSQARKPEFWGVPLMPWTPAASIFLNVFLLGSLDGPSYARFGLFSALVVLVYLLYSVHASFDAEGIGSLGGGADAVAAAGDLSLPPAAVHCGDSKV